MHLIAPSVATAVLWVTLAPQYVTASVTGGLRKRMDIADGTELRILPLGDSITVGFKSSDGNGYRLGLQENLAGSKLRFVGGLSNGTMTDNFNAGYSGYTINEISGAANDAITSDRPNVILLHAGTNDLDRGDNPPDPISKAPDRLGQLIDKCISSNPDAAIIVAQIINAADPGTESKIQTFNAAVPGIVDSRARAGHHCMVASMESITAGDLIDGLHPTDAGYRKMADLWLNAIKVAAGKGWIHSPIGPDPIPPPRSDAYSGDQSGKPASGSCLKTRDTSQQRCLGLPIWHNPAPDNGLIASGVAKGGDAKFVMNWLPQGRVALGIGKNGSNVRFADLNSDGRADYLWVNQDDGAVIAYLNTGQGNEISWKAVNDGKPMAYGVGKGAGVHFGNMGGQKQVDYLLVDHDNGAVHLYENKGPNDNSLGKWRWDGPTLIASGAPGANHWNVEFADINGDGRDDYIVVGDHGSLDLYLNIGKPGEEKPIWIPSGQVATGVGRNFTLAGRFHIDGDGRDDYLTWTEFGGLSGYLNVRDRTEALPKWVDQGSDKSIATGVGVDWRLCRLADFTGDGKADYAVIDVKNGGVDLYINDGSADTSVPGDAIFLADLDGDGLDDYVSMDQHGKIIAYLNGGADASSYLGWKWTPQNKGNAIALGVGARRHQIRLANIYGHGRADYLVIDDKTGAVTAWENEGPDNSVIGAWRWTSRGQIATGLGEGAGVRFADIDGDGRDDYTWLSEEGKALVYINKVGQLAQNWVGLNAGKYVALGVGAYRKDIRLADLDGDGRADYIWVHPVDGSINVWRNDFEAGPGSWIPYKDKLALGVGLASPNIHFAYINNDHTGRADYVAVEPRSGGLRVWLNGCNKLAPGSGSSGQGGGNGKPASCQAAPNPTSTSPSSNSSPTNINGSPSDNNGVPAAANAVLVTVGDSTYTANSNTQIIIEGQTLTPGGQIVVGGTTVSLSPGASVAVVGGSTQTLDHIVPSPVVGSLVFGGSTYTANSASQFVIGGQTLAPNEQITISGTPISLAPGASFAVIAGSTQALGSAQANPLGLPVFTLDGSTITANSASQFVIGDQTLTPGGRINVHGTSIMLPSDASAIVVGTSTQRPAVLTSAAGPGDVGTTSAQPVPVESATVGPALTKPTPVSLAPQEVPQCAVTVDHGSTRCISTTRGGGDGITIPGYTTIASAPKHGNLPTSGLDAINALLPAANGLLSLLGAAGSAFSDLAGGAASSLTSGAVSDAAGLFTNTIEDGESLLNAMNSFEMQSFDSIGGNLASEFDAAKSSLRNLIDLLRTTPGQFAQWISKPPTGLTDYRKIAAYLVGADSLGGIAAVAIRRIIQSTVVASSSSSKSKAVGVNVGSNTATSASSSSSASATPREWTLNTVPGTSIAAFESFVESLPDKGTGRRYTYSALDYQDYTGTWTLDQAKIISKNPLVDQIYPNEEMEMTSDRVVPENTTYERHPRVEPQQIYHQSNSPANLRIISLLKTEPIPGFDQHAEATEYTYEPSLGEGTFIYHFDSNFDLSHPEFSTVNVERYSHPRAGNFDPEHGTGVAAMAVGDSLGVAKKATLVAVQISRYPFPEDIKDIWRWAINDIKTKHRTGKAILLWPRGGIWHAYIEQNDHVDYTRWAIPLPEYCDTFLPLLAEAWTNDIITVVTSGNDASIPLGERTPQRYGKFYNALITVGTMTADGGLDSRSCPPGPLRNGHDPDLTGNIDFYALSVNLRVATTGGGYALNGGSSFAAPQVAGLAAYLLTVANPSPELQVGQISLDVKALLRILGRRLRTDLPILINNGIRDAFCGPGTKLKGREITYLEDRYYNRHILGSSGNESSLALDHSIKTVFTEGADKEGPFGGILSLTSLSSNQSSMDNFFALPTQDLAIARDLQGRFQPPNPSFFTTTADSISESATPKQTVTQLDSPSPSPTTHSTPESATLKQTVTELHSASASPTSVGVNGVQITDFSGLDFSCLP